MNPDESLFLMRLTGILVQYANVGSASWPSGVRAVRPVVVAQSQGMVNQTNHPECLQAA